ncbi:MAG TPA: DMT family transporter [Candidatus Paceibacterota bacterium]
MPSIELSLIFVIIGQLLNAVIVLIDKYIVTKTAISRPVVYSFFVGLISSVALLLLPFGVIDVPEGKVIWLSLFGGAIFIGSIIFLFSALKVAAATDVVPWLAAISTITTFLLSFFFLDESLPRSFPYALILFVIGMLLVGHFRFNSRSFSLVMVSGILFGFSALIAKLIFNETDFVSGFFWSRMGNVVAALSLLLWPEVRFSITESSRNITHKDSFLVVINRVLGGIALFAILYAIKVGEVSLVNALASLQFVFIFLLIFLLRHHLRDIYEHEFRPGHVLHKVLSMLFILAGFFVIFL